MASPPVGRSSHDGILKVDSGSPKKRNSERFPNFFVRDKDKVEQTSSAPPSLGDRFKAGPPSSNRSLPNSPPKDSHSLYWQEILSIEREFHSLLKVLSDPNAAEYAIVHCDQEPHIRLNGTGIWKEQDLLDAIDTLLGFMERALSKHITQLNPGPEKNIIVLGIQLFKNPYALDFLNKNPAIRKRWFAINIDFKVCIGLKACTKASELLKMALPSLKVINIALIIRQKKVTDEIKKILHPQDLAEKTLKRNPDWHNEKIIEQLDLSAAYIKCGNAGMDYFKFMHYVNSIFWKPEQIGGYCEEHFEASLSSYFSILESDLERYFELVACCKANEFNQFIESIELGFHTEDKKDMARYNYDRHEYQKALNLLNENLTLLCQRVKPLEKMLSQMVNKGLFCLEKMGLPRIQGVKEKMTAEETIDALKKISQALYPQLLVSVKLRLEEWLAQDKTPESEELKRQFHHLKRSSDYNLESLSRLYYTIESKFSHLNFQL